MIINDIDFEIKPLNRSQRKELRSKGFSVLEKAKKISVQKGKGLEAIPFDEDEIETFLDIAFKGRDADLEKISLMDQVNICAETFLATLDNPAKNS